MYVTLQGLPPCYSVAVSPAPRQSQVRRVRQGPSVQADLRQERFEHGLTRTTTIDAPLCSRPNTRVQSVHPPCRVEPSRGAVAGRGRRDLPDGQQLKEKVLDKFLDDPQLHVQSTERGSTGVETLVGFDNNQC